MTLINIVPDRKYGISENHLRMQPIASDMPPELWAAAVWPSLEKAIETMERLRKWTMLETVPKRKLFLGGGEACCEKMKLPVGSPLSIILRPSEMQGDPRDHPDADRVVTDGQEGTPTGDLYLTAVLHFWQPGISFNRQELVENMPTEKQGFVSPENLPVPLLKGMGHVYDDYFRTRNRRN